MKTKRNYSDIDIITLRHRHFVIRGVILVVTFLLIFIILAIKRSQTEQHRKQQELIEQKNDSIKKARVAEKERLYREQYEMQQKLRDSLNSITISTEPVEEEKPKYTWSRLEIMVQDLTDEGYYASIWKVDDNTSAWMVIYQKKGKYYIRKVNPETDTYGPATRLRLYDIGKYHVYGDKSRWYKYAPHGNDLIYEVKGKERARYINYRSINLYTPEPSPDGYEDWEDYYYDHEEDIYFYYNGR